MPTITRRLFVLAAASTVALQAGGALAQTTPEVKIGVVLPLSGSSAAIGNQTRLGVQIAVDQINAAGGIKALGGAKLQLLFGDSQGKPDIGSSETERLIQRENVSLILGAYNSAVTFPATEVAERYKTPWLVTGAVKDEITERGFKYVFRPNNKAQFDAREQIDAIDLLKKETGKGPVKLGLFYEGSDWGRSHMAAIKKLAGERGYQIGLDESYPQGQVDFSSQMLKVRAARPEALLIVAYTPDHILFSRQMFENRIDIPYGIHSVGGGAEDPAYYKALPPKALNYLFVQEDWQIDRLKADTGAELVDANGRFKKELGYEINSYGAQGLSNAYIIRDVLERAASTDREKIRAAFAATDISSGPALVVGYQRIKFDEQGQNPFAHGVISQNIGGERRTIWPAENRLKDTQPAWPVPNWSKR